MRTKDLENKSSSDRSVKGKDQKIFNLIAYPLMGLLALVCFLPFWLIISASFTDNNSIIKEGYHFFPKAWSLDAYRYILAAPETLLSAYKVSIIVTVLGTLISIILVTMSGYVLNRKDLRYRNQLSFFIYYNIFMVNIPYSQ